MKTQYAFIAILSICTFLTVQAGPYPAPEKKEVTLKELEHFKINCSRMRQTNHEHPLR